MTQVEVGRDGRYGKFGGQFVNEMLMPALLQLEKEFDGNGSNPEFWEKFESILENFGGRPTPLYHAENFGELIGCKVYLKREDLLYGGSHKLNNTIGQALLAREMGKKRLITETAAGMHGVASAIAGNVIGLEVEIFIGVKDVERQPSNVDRMRLLGADITPVDIGKGVLKDAVSDTLRAWTSRSGDTHYLMGSTVGPHPFPEIVARFQSVIGKEIKDQIVEKEGGLPDAIVACGSGGSNSLGAFRPFIDEDVRLHFVEGGGQSLDADNSAAAFQAGSPGVIHGALTYTLQDRHGQIKPSKTRSAGLNYPARGPQLSHLFETGRMKACYAFDDQVFEAVKVMAETEGLIPALETAHAVAYLIHNKENFERGETVVLNYSGRGDKDIDTILRYFNDEN